MFVKITNGEHTYRVSKGSFNNFYKPQGFYVVDEEAEDKEKFQEQMHQEVPSVVNEEMEALASIPLSEMNQTELRQYAKFLGVDLTGVKNINEARKRIKARLNED